MRLICLLSFAISCLLTGCSSSRTASAELEKRNIPFKETEFLLAVGQCDSQLVKLFLRAGMNPNATNDNGHTALTTAAQVCCEPIMRELVEAGAVVDGKSPNGATPLIWAAAVNCPKGIVLFKNAGANLNTVTTDEGNTALWNAVKFGHVDCVKLLLEFGANPNITNNYGQTALSVAEESNGDNPIRDLLVKFGAK